MFFKRLPATIVAVAFFQLLYADQTIHLHSPDGNIELGIERKDNGDLFYKITYKEKIVIASSGLGFKLISPETSLRKFDIVKTDSSQIDEIWKPVWGEQNSIRNAYKQLALKLNDHSGSGITINIIFRVFNEGVGFRYEFPRQPQLKYFIIADEVTEFNLTGDHKTFWIPGDYDSNEYPYTTSDLSEVDGWKIPIISSEPRGIYEPDRFAVQTPLMMKTADGLYINIHEAALVNFPSMQLHVNRTNFSLSCNLVPDAYGNKAYLRTPSYGPWRTIIVSDKAIDILASRMILNLNEPSKIANTSWIQPMKFIGVWWEMQTGKGSWSYSDNPDSFSAKGNG